MKNIDRLKRNIEKYNWNNATLEDLTAFTDLEELTPIHELLEKLVKFLLDGNKNPHFSNITDFLEWCEEEPFCMSKFIYDTLSVFDEGRCYIYIIRTRGAVYLHDCAIFEYSDGIDLTELGFKYDDFDFMKEDEVYFINRLIENAVIKECGD